jgi:hypothetical protein
MYKIRDSTLEFNARSKGVGILKELFFLVPDVVMKRNQEFDLR